MIWEGLQRRDAEKGLPTDTEQIPPRLLPEAAWAALDVTCRGHVISQNAQQQNTLRQCTESTYRGLLQAPSKKPRRPLLPPRPLGRLCVLWLLGLHHMPGRIFVASQGLICNEGIVDIVAGKSTSGDADGVGTSASFNEPYGMSTSPDGSYILIADFNNHMIRKLVVSSGAVSTFAGNGAEGSSNGIANYARFSEPRDVSISANGLFAVSTCLNSHRIRRIVLSTRLVTTIAGGGSTGHVNGVGTNSRFDSPMGISLYSGDSRAFVVDNMNNRIRLIVMSSLQVTTVAGSGTLEVLMASGHRLHSRILFSLQYLPMTRSQWCLRGVVIAFVR